MDSICREWTLREDVLTVENNNMSINKKQGVKVLAEFAKLQIPFNFSWDVIMQVVDKLEALDLKDKIYSWEDSRGMNYNFQCVEVEISSSKCWITIELDLDPCIIINKEWAGTQYQEWYNSSRLDAVFYSCVEAVEYLKEKQLI